MTLCGGYSFIAARMMARLSWIPERRVGMMKTGGAGGTQMSKHTPGPWTNDDGLVNGIESRTGRVEQTPSLDIFDAGDWPSALQDEAQANAKLIAAAPDMLAALKLFISTYAATQTHPTIIQEAAVISAIRAAIAKAETD